MEQPPSQQQPPNAQSQPKGEESQMKVHKYYLHILILNILIQDPKEGVTVRAGPETMQKLTEVAVSNHVYRFIHHINISDS